MEVTESPLQDLLNKHNDPYAFALDVIKLVRAKKVTLNTRGAASTRELVHLFHRAKKRTGNKVNEVFSDFVDAKIIKQMWRMEIGNDNPVFLNPSRSEINELLKYRDIGTLDRSFYQGGQLAKVLVDIKNGDVYAFPPHLAGHDSIARQYGLERKVWMGSLWQDGSKYRLRMYDFADWTTRPNQKVWDPIIAKALKKNPAISKIEVE